MNEELGKQLATFVASLNKGADFAVSQAPDVIQQLILVNLIQYSLGSILCLSILAASYYFAFVFKHKKDEYGNGSTSQFISWLIGGLVSLFVFIILCCNVQSLILIHFAPKIFLMQEAARFLK